MTKLISALKHIKSILGKLKWFLTDEKHRSEKLVQIFHADEVQQTTQLTFENRYPDEFKACMEHFGHDAEINILSFGCCTGEEVVSLRHYFPNATIVGADINNYSLKQCRKRKLDNKIKFIKSSRENILKYGPYDIVFCMAVLQRTPQLIRERGTKSIADIYPFDKYEKQINELNQYVKTSGLLVIHFTQYDFMNTAISKEYEPFNDYKYLEWLFDKNGNLLGEVGLHSMYKKKAEN